MKITFQIDERKVIGKLRCYLVTNPSSIRKAVSLGRLLNDCATVFRKCQRGRACAAS
jgi:hypothetical protein